MIPSPLCPLALMSSCPRHWKHWAYWTCCAQKMPHSLPARASKRSPAGYTHDRPSQYRQWQSFTATSD